MQKAGCGPQQNLHVEQSRRRGQSRREESLHLGNEELRLRETTPKKAV